MSNVHQRGLLVEFELDPEAYRALHEVTNELVKLEPNHSFARTLNLVFSSGLIHVRTELEAMKQHSMIHGVPFFGKDTQH